MSEIMAWLDTLEPTFLFMLALPFAVAAAGLAAEAIRRRRRRAEPKRSDSSIRRGHVNAG